MNAICVFCGSSSGMRAEYLALAEDLGALMAKAGITLVYGGGRLGLMGRVADACMASGGRVIGVIPQALMEREHGHRGITQLEVVESMHQRKARMAELCDGFVALPGGYGTLEELLEMLTWSQLGIHAKPIAVVNTLNFFSPLITMLDHASEEGFIRAPQRRLLLCAESAADALAVLRNFHPAKSATQRELEG